MIAKVAGEELVLHPFKAVFWPKESILLIADLHLGKATHFRKEGIAVPAAVSDTNWDRLTALLLEFKPKRVLILGDLFHSHYNSEWEDFGQLLAQFNQISFELVSGNHDILPAIDYDRINLTVYPESLFITPFWFTHHPIEEHITEGYNLSGHIHPGVRMKGNGRQYLRLPCFLFGPSQGILPAFGAFTGMATVRPTKRDQVFVIGGDEIIQVSG